MCVPLLYVVVVVGGDDEDFGSGVSGVVVVIFGVEVCNLGRMFVE